MSDKALKLASHWRRVHDKAERAVHTAQLQQYHWHIEYADAQISLRDAWLDEMELQAEAESD